MNAEQLAEIEERAEAATPGPWESLVDEDVRYVVETEGDTRIADDLTWRDDGVFIAHARTDVPRLVAELRNVTGERDVARSERDQAEAAIGRVQKIAEAMQARADKVVHGDPYEQGMLLVLNGVSKDLLTALDSSGQPADAARLWTDEAAEELRRDHDSLLAALHNLIPQSYTSDAVTPEAVAVQWACDVSGAIERARQTLDRLLLKPGAVTPDMVWQLREDLGLNGSRQTADHARIACICGSTRFRAEMAAVNCLLTLAGLIVVAPGVFAHDGDAISDEEKQQLDQLHLRKIDLADEVHVVNPGGYIGESTRREIAYAEQLGKPVKYLHVADQAEQDGGDR